MRIENILWLDACFFSEAMDEEEIEDATGVRVHTTGWVVREDSLGILIAHERFEDGRIRGATYIPKGIVINRKVLNGGEDQAEGH